MIRELESAILARLGNPNTGVTDALWTTAIKIHEGNRLVYPQVQPVKLALISVPITMQLPDEWATGESNYPCINVWRTMDEINHDLYRLGFQTRITPNPDGTVPQRTAANNVDLKWHQVPVHLTYELSMRARYQEQIREMKEAIEMRFPKFGVGSTFMVPYADGPIEVPWEQVGYLDLTEMTAAGEREMEARLIYRFKAWSDEFPWQTTGTVREVVVTVQDESHTPPQFTDTRTLGESL